LHGGEELGGVKTGVVQLARSDVTKQAWPSSYIEPAIHASEGLTMRQIARKMRTRSVKRDQLTYGIYIEAAATAATAAATAAAREY